MENKKYYHHYGKFPTNNGSKIAMKNSTFREQRAAHDPSFDFIHTGEQFKSAINSSLRINNDKYRKTSNRQMKETLLSQRRKNYSTDYSSRKMLGNTTMAATDS